MNIKVGTIRQIHRELTANGYIVSENAIRQWIKTGVVPAAYSGKVAFISYDAVIAFLTSPSNQTA